MAGGARHRLLSAVQSRNKTSGLGHLADNELRRSERSARLPCKLIQSISSIEPLTPEWVIPKKAWHQLDSTRGKDCPTTADRQTCSILRYHIARDQPFGRLLATVRVSLTSVSRCCRNVDSPVKKTVQRKVHEISTSQLELGTSEWLSCEILLGNSGTR